MTDQEKEALKEEILSEIVEKFKGSAIREDIQGTLAEARDKWFRDAGKWPNFENRSPMFEAFGNYTYWSVWEHIRKLTCFICGQRYVRQLGGDTMANEIAEALCQTVYDLRLEHMGKARGESDDEEKSE